MFAVLGLGWGEILVLGVIGVLLIVPVIVGLMVFMVVSRSGKEQRSTVQQLREEIDDLRAENERLRKEIETLRAAGANSGIKPSTESV
ncbi:MAG TPA: hypothetical protein VFE62_24435 [Gemmataceae bacterium]|nr:hypothetical protein [Gemmataceae bacterium]